MEVDVGYPFARCELDGAWLLLVPVKIILARSKADKKTQYPTRCASSFTWSEVNFSDL